MKATRIEERPNQGRSRERIDLLVRGYVGWGSGDEALREKVVDRIMETGECVWHALAVVTGKKCWCANCAKGGA